MINNSMEITHTKQRGNPFNFLAIENKKSRNPVHSGCDLAWADDHFWAGNNYYYVYTCHSCGDKRINRVKDNKWYN